MAKSILFSILFVVTAVINNIAQCPKLVWSDEFNENNLDLKNWSYQIGDGCDINLCGWGNNELQYYQSQNAVVSNGTLKIIARREQVGNRQYTSARIRSINKVDIKFGRIEARMKMPIGQGLWPAFWMLPTDNVYGGWPRSGEIDIMEYLGHEPNTIHGTLHFGNLWPNNQSTSKKYVLPEGGFNENFHVYALEWTDQKFNWYIDGYLFATKTRADVNAQWPFDQRFHFLLNLAVGGTWPGNPNSATIFPQTFEIDYIRVYDKTGLPHLEGPEKVVESTHNVIFKIANPIDNSQYEWSLPEGSTIVDGQNSASIKVNWGSQSGLVKVKINNNCEDVTYSLFVKTEGALKKRQSLENFDDPALLTKGFSSGVLTAKAKNTTPNTINNSEFCGEYKRSSTTQYDVLFYSTNVLTDVSKFVSGEEKFYIDIYTDAPIGTQILLQLENSNRATTTNYPTGRHSRFVITTTKQNEWERMSFSLLDRPDTGVSNTSVNNLVILFAPNSFTGHTYKFDNFDIYDRSILSNLDKLNPINITLYPNPIKGQRLQLLSDEILTQYQINDLNGRVIGIGSFKNADTRYEIDVEQLPKGTYILNVFTLNRNSQVLTFIKN